MKKYLFLLALTISTPVWARSNVSINIDLAPRVELQYMDVYGIPEVYPYDERGNLVIGYFYDTDGRLCYTSHGYRSIIRYRQFNRHVRPARHYPNWHYRDDRHYRDRDDRRQHDRSNGRRDDDRHRNDSHRDRDDRRR